MVNIIKVPRGDHLKDIPIGFGPLDNLHLELLENKNKVKPGLPAVPIKQRKPPVITKQKEDTSKKDGGVKKKDQIKNNEELNDEEDLLDDDLLDDDLLDDEDFDLVKDLGEDDIEDDIEDDMVPDDEVVNHENEDEEEDPYAHLSPEEREREEKEEFLWKFKILKKGNRGKTFDVPEFNEHSDLDLMKKTYKRTVREIHLDKSVETYRSYLVTGFMAMEFGCYFLGIDLEGFAKEQIAMLDSYDHLLIELGEKSYSTWGTGLPVELRLLAMIMFQGAIFYIGKRIYSGKGESASELFRAFTGRPPAPAQTEESAPKKKMKGPRLKPDDIRKTKDVNTSKDN